VLKSKNFVVLFFGVSAVVVAGASSMDEIAQVQNKQPSNSQSIKKLGQQAKAFDPSMISGDYLSDDFYAYDIKAVTGALAKVGGLSKDKYESSDEYKSRMVSVFNKTKILGVEAGEIIAIQIPVNSENLPYEGVKFTFNADRERLDFHILSKKKPLVGYFPEIETSGLYGMHNDVIDVERRVDKESAYLGSNALGATATVRSYKLSQFGLVSYTLDWLSHPRKSDYIFDMPVGASIEYTRDQARHTLNNLRAVLLMKVRFPYVISGRDFKRATMDSTYENNVTVRYITGDLMGVVFYDGKTKKVIHRMPENFGK
jgi:hypothetical protein